MMRAVDARRMRVNRQKWDESVPLHVASRVYDVPAFRRGADPLLPCEIALMGPVRGRSLVHLQCHFGMDTLAWARRGARVTGVDYSAPAIAAAQKLAREVRVPARFVRSNVYGAGRRLRSKFDLVYTGKGALCWLPDLAPWARVVAGLLRPGGRLFYLEDHPIAEVHEREGPRGPLVRRNRYFQRPPFRDEFAGTYAVSAPVMRHRVSYSWIHPIQDAIGAIVGAGLVLDSFVEYPFSYWRRYTGMRSTPDGYWHLRDEPGRFPLMYSLRAHRPGGVRARGPAA
ncbi:MAG TPA: class I SAM-dependent methyltransferase [Thermoplasmata archaeon]|nr:class I SAM-dependent methyltransferase [Thermoplasmata archaeon]